MTRGTGFIAKLVAKVFGFPQATDDVDVTVSFEQQEGGERWTRTFGDQEFTSLQYEGSAGFERLVCEKFGPFVFGLALKVESSRLVFVVRRWSLLGVPMPRFLAPTGESCEFDEDGMFHFDVKIEVPVVGLIVRYTGFLEPQKKS